ncbi:MAG: hypothetical protein HY700_20245 [Gemmatimonadetes bacterium]|nr:hypothetical protein [Gemmatimonadota bacterium]
MTLFFIGLAAILAGGVVAAVTRMRSTRAEAAFGGLVVAGSILALVPALRVLGGAASPVTTVPSRVPGGPWEFGIDALAAFFLLVVLGVGSVIAIYGIGYLRAERSHRSIAGACLGFSALLVSLALVVTARAAIPFLIAWESMSVLGYLVILFEHERADVRRAGLVYLVATHVGTLALFLLFAAWARVATDLRFDTLAASAANLPRQGQVILLLALVGFGVKAGLVPLHFWLPGAHSAAPSHVSAIMSGVVIKMGIYGLLRVGALLAPTPAWWGWTLLSLGLIGGVLGVLWALAQHDLKRLLAYHSVENIGIILLGMGLGFLGITYRQPAVAAIGFAGAVLHTLNHALFKSLLFFGAGSVLRATGTREIDKLGGLARAMPVTWILFLIGAAAIVGLPPLNGFVSEWLVFQALFRSGLGADPMRLAVIGASGLALIGTLALACFAKVAGIIFLGRPRSAAGAQGEAPPLLLAPMAALAAACAMIGLFAGQIVKPALRAGALLARTEPLRGASSDVALAARSVGLLAIALTVIAAVGYGLLARLRARRPIRREETWGCGYAKPDPVMQYTASSFAAPLLAAYAPVVGLRVQESATSFHSHPTEVVLERTIQPLGYRVRSLAARLRPIQQGRLHIYLFYMIAVLLGLILYLVAA